MNKRIAIIVVAVFVCAAALIYAFGLRQPAETPPGDGAAPRETAYLPEEGATVEVPVGESDEESPSVSAALEEALDKEPVVAEPREEPGEPLSGETLKGTKWSMGARGDVKIVCEFADNGEWRVNGETKARWQVIGDRVRIYNDDLGEEHYVDIDGDKLTFDGEVISRAP